MPGQIPPVEDVDDEVRDQGDITNFRLFDPAGNQIEFQTYGPFPQPPAAAPASHNVWNQFYTINLPPNPVEGQTCGIFQIETWTGDEGSDPTLNNDDNAWKYRILGGPDTGNIDAETFDPAIGPDGRPGTGDEAALGIQRLSFQHNSSQEQTFYWFVDDAASPTWTGNNFDIDDGTNLCPTADACQINYFSPSGIDTPATTSGNRVWNPGQNARLGDQFTNAESGLWSADVLIPVNNQYIIEIANSGKPIFLDEPVLPELIITKDDGVVLVTSPGVTTYTIEIENIGEGAALPVSGPEVIDTLPPGMTFSGCVIEPPLNGSCGEFAPGSGVVNFDLGAQNPALNANDGSAFGPILAYLPGVDSGLITQGKLTVIANIQPGLPGNSIFTNTVSIDWTDLYKNNYVPKTARDVDLTSSLDLQLSKKHIPTVVEPGGILTYTITITNVGDAVATGVVITDQIPANTTFVSASDGGTFANGIITWNIPTLITDETVSRQVVVRLDNPFPAGVDNVTNTACVGDDGASGADRNPQDNCDTVSTPITNTPQVFLDPIIVKTVDVADVVPNDPVNYSITISNPSSNSNVSATDVFLIDGLPREMDLVSYSVSSNPASLVISSTTVTTDVISTGDHPSGITQTVVSTITVAMPKLGLDESVTLNIAAKANGLAGPPPLSITNIAALEYNKTQRKEDRKTVNVREQGSSPTPTPTRTPSSGGGNNNDNNNNDDDGNTKTSTSNNTPNNVSVQNSSNAPAPATATPVLPVLLLPETGFRDSQVPSPIAIVGLLGTVSLGGLLLWKLLKGNSPE